MYSLFNYKMVVKIRNPFIVENFGTVNFLSIMLLLRSIQKVFIKLNNRFVLKHNFKYRYKDEFVFLDHSKIYIIFP